MITLILAATLYFDGGLPPIPDGLPSIPMKSDLEPELSAQPSYAVAYWNAQRTKRPLLIFVGLSMREVDGMVACSVKTFNGNSTPRIILLVDGVVYDGTGATDAELRRAAGLERAALAVPFFNRPGEVRLADVDLTDGSLPSILQELEPYETAKRVQHTFRRWSGYIGSADRKVSKPEWKVPGGLSGGIENWNSKLFRKGRSTTLLVRQDPNDGDSAVTWGRSYEDGAVFADVLRNDKGQVFEVRVAEKNDGAWSRYVAYKDVNARLEGYVTPTRQQCNECHVKAGRSEYADVAIPGADEVFSDPIPIVERGEIVQGGYGVEL